MRLKQSGFRPVSLPRRIFLGLVHQLFLATDPRDLIGQLAPRHQKLKRHGAFLRGPWRRSMRTRRHGIWGRSLRVQAMPARIRGADTQSHLY